MDADRFRQITELFEAAVELPQGERPSYLDSACADDAELRREVERLLAADEKAASFLDEPPATPSGRPPPPRIGKYEVVEKIGQGGFGEVFRGRDPLIRRQVAIKTCTYDDPDFRRRFLREAEIAGRLDHPNVVTVYDSGFHDGLPYLVQEFLPGEDLEETVRRRRPLAAAVRLDYLRQIARGLEYAHARGVVHRDVKPSNLRRTDDGRVKILDFGIARLATAETRLTRTGTAIGTVAYMAPEQLRGEAVDGRADVFSFGVVAYELLTYRRPFPAESNATVLYQILERSPEPLERLWPACPPELARLVARCLEKDAAARYPGFTEVLADLAAIEAPEGPIEIAASPDAEAAPGEASPLEPTLPVTPKERRQGARPAAARRFLRLAAAAALGAAALAAVILGAGEAYRFLAGRGYRPAPAAAVAPPGRLAIDARPWAEVVRIVDAEGAAHDFAGSRTTPLAVALPPGEYVVTLRHPGHPQPRQCRATVEAGATAHCRGEFARLDAREFFARLGARDAE